MISNGVVERSETITHVLRKIFAVQKAIAVEEQKKRGDMAGRYSFHKIDDIRALMSRHLTEKGLCLLPVGSVPMLKPTFLMGKNQEVRNPVIVTDSFMIADPDTGEYIVVVKSGEGSDTIDHSVGKASSDAWKELIIELFMPSEKGIQFDIDDDDAEKIGSGTHISDSKNINLTGVKQETPTAGGQGGAEKVTKSLKETSLDELKEIKAKVDGGADIGGHLDTIKGIKDKLAKSGIEVKLTGVDKIARLTSFIEALEGAK